MSGLLPLQALRMTGEIGSMPFRMARANRKGSLARANDPWKGKGKGKAPVNAYALNHYVGWRWSFKPNMMVLLNMPCWQPKKVAAPRKTYVPREIPPGGGMIDSGAACSAGPETSVQRLVTKIMEADAAAQIRAETKDQSRFRFGSGKWGQALYKLTVSSSITGGTSSFSCFAFPDPKERHEEWFTMDMLVPVLVGMDWLKEAGAVLDFNDGHCFLPLMSGVLFSTFLKTKRVTTFWMMSKTSLMVSETPRVMLQYMSCWKSL